MSSDETQTLIDVDVSDVGEATILNDGEYQLRVLSVQERSGEGGRGPWQNISLLLLPISGDDLDDPDTFYQTEWIPLEGASKNQRRRFNSFKSAMGIEPAEPFALEDLQGREAWAVVGMKDDPDYGRQNIVKRWVVGAQ